MSGFLSARDVTWKKHGNTLKSHRGKSIKCQRDEKWVVNTVESILNDWLLGTPLEMKDCFKKTLHGYVYIDNQREFISIQKFKFFNAY